MKPDHLPQGIDPITFQILWARVVNIADEMAATLVKTAFSHVVRDNHDYACGIYDGNGRMLAESTQCTPGQIGAMPRVVRALLASFSAESLTPGDVLITNDPWIGSGHTPDIFLATPIFHTAGLVGFAVNCAHHIDIGGRMAAPDAREVYEEGLIIPVTRFHASGVVNDDLLQLIRRNVRMPEKVVGDLRAQLAANHAGVRGICTLLDETGIAGLTDLARAITDYTERSMRAAIAEVPDGIYRNEVRIDDVGFEGRPLDVRVRLEVRDDEVHVDFVGTSGQVDLPVNCVYNITYAYTLFPIKCALHPHIPNNEGCARPIHLSVPEGTILNARFPAACMWRTSMVYFAVEAIFGALVAAIPDSVMAPSGTYPLWLQTFRGTTDDGHPFVVHFNAQGGQGARASKDGVSTTVFPPNVSNTPVEMLEAEAPLLCEKKALLPNSGGPGRHRGGLGQEVVLRNLAPHPVTGSVVGGRLGKGPPGLLGGYPGAMGRIRVNDGEVLARSRQVVLEPGEFLRLTYPGGGGFGHPFERNAEAVLDDVRRGLITADRIEADYGVALDSSLDAIDAVRTKRLRAARHSDGDA